MKLGLQITVGILSLIPSAFGSLNAILGAGRFLPQDAVNAAIDSQFRFQSSIYLGLAFVIWWMLPNIEKHTTLFRLVIAALFIGGVSRLYSLMTIGPPPPVMIGGMVLELCLPLLILWHNKIRARP